MTTTELTCAEYDRLREQAAQHLTVHALFALLAAKLPKRNLRVAQAWDIFATAMLEEYSK